MNRPLHVPRCSTALETMDHRNLSTRTCMLGLLLQTFWAKKPCKKSADLHPRQGNLLLHKIGWRPAEKNSPVFFSMRVLDLDFYAMDPILDVVLSFTHCVFAVNKQSACFQQTGRKMV
jgi:hypothetical protein